MEAEPTSNVPIKKQKLSRIGNSFSTLIEEPYFVDKTLIIRSIMNLFTSNLTTETKKSPLSIFTPRRFGKTAILDLLECFFGGMLLKEKFFNLKIEAFDWYDKFTVVYITFGNCLDVIQNREDYVTSCQMLLHHSFRAYSYILDYLSTADYEAFKEWISEKDCKNKKEDDIIHGLRFLIECVGPYYGNRPIRLTRCVPYAY